MKALCCSIILAIFLTAPGCESPPTASPAPPQADAGEDLRVQVGELAVLDGSGSADAADDGQLNYAWVQLSGPLAVGIQNAGSPQALVVPETAGVYVFRLTVMDDQGVSATDEVHMLALGGEDGNGSEVPDVNTPPRASAGPDLERVEGEMIMLDGGASFDAEDGALSYAWVQLSGPLAVGIQDAGSPQALVVPEAAGVYVFRLTVTDSQGISATDEMRLIAVPGRKVGTVRITGAPLDWGVMRVEYLIAAADIDTLRGSLVITSDLVASGTVLAVEAGRDRLIELYAYDDSDRKVAFGSALIAVEENRPVEVTIEMKALLPTVGEIEIEAVFEDLGG